jgi:hypothetical protein
VQRVSEAATSMLERIDAMETELRGLLDGVRAGSSRVSSDLALLQAAVSDLRGVSSAGFEPDPVQPTPAASIGASYEPAIAEPEPVYEPEPFPAEPAASDRPADEEGARLIAFNMALNGTPREETEAYLRDNFDLSDPGGLLDDVYAQAGL